FVLILDKQRHRLAEKPHVAVAGMKAIVDVRRLEYFAHPLLNQRQVFLDRSKLAHVRIERSQPEPWPGRGRNARMHTGLQRSQRKRASAVNDLVAPDRIITQIRPETGRLDILSQRAPDRFPRRAERLKLKRPPPVILDLSFVLARV